MNKLYFGDNLVTRRIHITIPYLKRCIIQDFFSPRNTHRTEVRPFSLVIFVVLIVLSASQLFAATDTVRIGGPTLNSLKIFLRDTVNVLIAPSRVSDTNSSGYAIHLKDIIGWGVLLLVAFIAFWQARRAITGTHENTLLQSMLEQHQKWAENFSLICINYIKSLTTYVNKQITYFPELKNTINNDAEFLSILRSHSESMFNSHAIISGYWIDINFSLNTKEFLDSGLGKEIIDMAEIYSQILNACAIDFTDKKALDTSNAKVSELQKELVNKTYPMRNAMDKVISYRKEEVLNSFKLQHQNMWGRVFGKNN